MAVPHPIGNDNRHLRKVTADMEEPAIATARGSSLDAGPRTPSMQIPGTFAPLKDHEGETGFKAYGMGDAAHGVPGRGAAA